MLVVLFMRNVLFYVTIQYPLSREVFWHKYAKIPRHTSKNAITEGDLREQRVKVRACTEP